MERIVGWPETQGTVTGSRIVWAHVEVAYEYSISSGRYTGKYKINLRVGPRSIAAEYIKLLPSIPARLAAPFDHPEFFLMKAPWISCGRPRRERQVREYTAQMNHLVYGVLADMSVIALIS